MLGTSAPDDPPVTIQEFDAFVERQANGTHWELVGGSIVGRHRPSTAHEQITGNIGAHLKLAADSRGCQAFFGGIRMQRSDNRDALDKPQPDLLVRCGSLLRSPFVTDPLVVVEVLSPTTMDVDRGDKLRFYKRLPTLLHIVLAYQDQMRIEHYEKDDRGWNLQPLTSPKDTLDIEALRFSMPLRDAYFGVFP